MIKGHLKDNNIPKALELLDEMKAGVAPDAVTYTHFSMVMYMPRICQKLLNC
jgi:pentatricopeptide repeat protein